MKKNKLIIFIVFILFLSLLAGGIGLYYYKTHYITASLEPEIQTEITGNKNRTECGWYQLYSYYLEPQKSLKMDELYMEKADSTGYEYRLSLIEFNLAEYNASQLDKNALQNIRTVLEHFSNTDTKVIIRFLYDWDGKGLETEPKDIKYIKKHMKQVGALLSEYKDIIYTTQGIFVGSWAEMHDSKYLSTKDMTTLVLYYAHVTDESIFLSVRTPTQYRTIVSELQNHSERYETYGITVENLKKRLGLYNDGMLGSVSDVGTYQKADDAPTKKESLAIRKKELDFQNSLCRLVPNGGEVVTPNVYNNTKNAIHALSTMHISYLNQTYDEKVIQKWKKAVYQDNTSIYNQKSTYEYITDHLGARFVLKDCSLSYKPFQKGKATGNITLENTGFANLYSNKQFTLSLINKQTNTRHILLDSSKPGSNIEPRLWDSQKKQTIPFSFSPFDYEDGIYALIVSLKDSATTKEYAFSNDSYHEKYQGYLLGNVTIKR